jgi:hypothetical protein
MVIVKSDTKFGMKSNVKSGMKSYSVYGGGWSLSAVNICVAGGTGNFPEGRAVQCSAVQCSAVQCSTVQCLELKLTGKLLNWWISSPRTPTLDMITCSGERCSNMATWCWEPLDPAMTTSPWSKAISIHHQDFCHVIHSCHPFT